MPDDLTTRVARLLWAKLPHPQTCPDEIDAAARAVVALVLGDAAKEAETHFVDAGVYAGAEKLAGRLIAAAIRALSRKATP